MSRKQLFVCLLAIAGSGSLFLAGQSGMHASSRLLRPAENSPQTQAKRHAARSVSPGKKLRLPAEIATVAPRPAPVCPATGACSAAFSLPMTFEPNRGQADAPVQFIGRGKGLTVFLTGREIAVQVAQSPRARSDASSGTVTLRLAGATDFRWRGEEKLRGESNYFIGNDPRAWRTRVPHFARAQAASAARGVAVVIYGNAEGVEYDLRLAPRTDVSKLRLEISGADDMSIASGGDLLLRAGGSELRMRKPEVYEEWPDTAPGLQKAAGRGERKRIDGRYAIEADGSVGFRVGPHDADATLVIDPSLSVAYATFLGGTGSDTAASVALDPTGKVYIGGTTTSATTFPASLVNRIGAANGPAQFFVAKIDPAVSGANSLVYLTFLGGSGTQAGGLIAVDGSGRVAITGTTTSVDFPVTDLSGPTSGLTSGNGNDVAVSEIDSTGSQLVFSTLFGGSGAESQNGLGGIALDRSGNVYVASDTHTTSVNPNSTDLPVTPGAFQTAWDGQVSDAFLAIFQPPPQPGGAPVLKYCSYLGTNASGGVGVGGVAVDASGNAYIAGSSNNAINGFPATQNALQTAYGGGDSDAFLMRISPAGQGSGDLVYATLLGGIGADQALAVALDSATPPNAYVTGTTRSANFPVNGTHAAYQGVLRANPLVSGSANAFLAVVAQNAITGATSLTYATYLGGSAVDAGRAVAVAAPNQVYVSGSTSSQDFPWHDNLQPFNGAADAFVAKFDPTSSGPASLVYATPLGGTSPPGGTASAAANGIAADGAGHVYVAGQTTSADFPTAVTTADTLNGFQQACVSCQQASPASDAFVAEIAESSAQAPSVYFNLGRVIFPPVPVGTQNAPQPVAVLNGGEAALTISDIRILGPNAGDFSISGQSVCIGSAISPGPVPQCSFEVGFTPSVVGPETAVVSVSDNAPGSPQVLELIGAGQGPLAVVSPPSLDFGNQPENTISAQRTITVTNAGNQTLTLASVAEAGPDVAQFQPQTGSTCQRNTSLPPGASCTVSVVFAPIATGSFHAEIEVQDNSGGSPNAVQVVALTGTGTPPAPIANILPASMAIGFGTVDVGATTGTQTATLTNVGSAALNLTSIAIAGANAPDFAIAPAGTSCPAAGGSVAIGASCTVAVQFAPQSGGTKTASLRFTDNAPASPQQVALSGTATAPAVLQVSPGSLTFASQSEGIASAPQTVTILNAGAAPASIGTVALSGANAGDFALQSPCAPSLGAGKSCQLSVSFSPAVSMPAGSRSATLNIPAGTPQTVVLAGTATQAGISLPTSFDFGSQLAGTAGTPQPVNVTNTSAGPLAGALAVAGVTKTGANPDDFALSTDNCSGSNTPPSGTCTIQVAFKPVQLATCGAAGGARSATLTLADNAPGSPHSIPLSGTATDFCFGSASGQPVSTAIPRGQSATYSLQIDSSAGFTGSVALGCTGAPPRGTCTITTTPPSTPPAVQVSPNTPGQFQVVVTTMAGLAPAGRPTPPNLPPLPASTPAWWLAAICAAILAIWALGSGAGAPRGRYQAFARLAQAGALLLVFAIGIAACGGGGASDPPPAGTPPGTYTVTVTATGPTGVTRTIPLSLTVQ